MVAPSRTRIRLDRRRPRASLAARNASVPALLSLSDPTVSRLRAIPRHVRRSSRTSPWTLASVCPSATRTPPGADTAPTSCLADPGTPFWKLVLKQFDDLLVKILIAAAVVSLVLGILDGEGASAMVEPGVIVLILVANATVGVLTETNAESAIEELKSYQADVATVLRDGRLKVAPATELVPGDVIEIAVGNKVPADARLIDLRRGSGAPRWISLS